jgi:alpha-beta hydrolase superfamily lysophospholipase
MVMCSFFIAILAVTGCGGMDSSSFMNPVNMDPGFVNEDRADKGLVVILPGIEGESSANQDIRKGLREGGIPYALAIYRWGSGSMLMNQTDVSGNRRKAEELAGRIATYQSKYSGRPVFLIGHSAGGGMAVFALEYLAQIPGAKPVDGVFLLSASISADYDLSYALRMTRRGLANVSNPEDQVLKGGTATFGNVDGGKGDSAGRTGFAQRYRNVYERPITGGEVFRDVGQTGPAHFVATQYKLIAKYAPAWIMAEVWPPRRAVSGE